MRKVIEFLLLITFIQVMAGCGLPDNSPVDSGADNLYSDQSEDITFYTQHPVYGNDIDIITCYIQNNTNKEFEYGEPYSIEKLVNGIWQIIPYIKKIAWNGLGHILKPNSTNTIYVSLSICNDTFKDGTYRICKEIEDKYYYAEFKLGKSNITASTPYGFQELEKIKANYTSEQAIADGAIVIEQNEIKNMEMADKFISNVSRKTASMLRIVQYTAEGDPVITDITFTVSYFTRRTKTFFDRYNGKKGIHETIFSYIVTDGNDIYLSNHSTYDDEESGEYVRLIPADAPPEWKNAVDLIRQVTKDRLSSNIATYKVYSSDGTKYTIMTQEPLQFGFNNSGYAELRNIENKMGIAVRINEVLWADDDTILIVCETNSDMKYYEFFNVATRSVVSYTASFHDYFIEDGKILIPE
jgi:hypothetical protein